MKKYEVIYSNNFKKDLKNVIKQGKDLNKLNKIVDVLANGEELDLKHKDHKLADDKYFKNCRELHIEPNWLLVYQIIDDELILLLVRTGSHSEVLDK